MIFECLRFNVYRKKFLDSITPEERFRLADGAPTRKLQQMLTSRNPETWRLFSWILSRIYAIRRRGWEAYQKEKLMAARDRQEKRYRVPRRAAAVRKMRDANLESKRRTIFHIFYVSQFCSLRQIVPVAHSRRIKSRVFSVTFFQLQTSGVVGRYEFNQTTISHPSIMSYHIISHHIMTYYLEN